MSDLRHYETPLWRSPLASRTEPWNRHSDWAPWSGWISAQSYGDIEMEHSAIRNAATLYDLSPMVKYRIAGTEGAAMLDRLTLRSVSRVPVGRVQYTAWCDDGGRVLDDGTLFRLGETEFRLCCQERHLPWLLDSASGFDVTVEEVTEDLAAIALQGPCSASVLAAAGIGVEALKPFNCRDFGDVLVSRTGFTGDLGYELWTAPGNAAPLWDRLMTAGLPWGIRPIGSKALDIARIEAGHVIAGVDFVPAEQALREDRPMSAIELGFGWMIDWDKGHFNGRRALLAERDGGTSRRMVVGLEIEGNIPADGAIVYLNKRTEVGTVTSAVWSPTTKKSLAIAQVDCAHRDSGRLWVEIYALRELQYARLMEKATPVPRPFFDPPRRRVTPPGAV